MNVMTWTLWFLSSGTIIGQGASVPPVPTPIATYDTHELCLNSMAQIYADTETGYGKKNTSRFPGFFFCVMTTQRK